jgi:hypothetical protein
MTAHELLVIGGHIEAIAWIIWVIIACNILKVALLLGYTLAGIMYEVGPEH